jgi:hypothetical protein
MVPRKLRRDRAEADFGVAIMLLTQRSACVPTAPATAKTSHASGDSIKIGVETKDGKFAPNVAVFSGLGSASSAS